MRSQHNKISDEISDRIIFITYNYIRQDSNIIFILINHVRLIMIRDKTSILGRDTMLTIIIDISISIILKEVSVHVRIC